MYLFGTEVDYNIAKPFVSPRILLHKYIYNNENNIYDLISLIQKHINGSEIVPDIENRSIMIKIKKSAMKQYPNFTHSTLFYYNIFDSIFRKYFFNMKFKDLFNNPKLTEEELCVKDLIGVLEYGNIATNLYNITCLNDNIVILQL